MLYLDAQDWQYMLVSLVVRVSLTAISGAVWVHSYLLVAKCHKTVANQPHHQINWYRKGNPQAPTIVHNLLFVSAWFDSQTSVPPIWRNIYSRFSLYVCTYLSIVWKVGVGPSCGVISWKQALVFTSVWCMVDQCPWVQTRPISMHFLSMQFSSSIWDYSFWSWFSVLLQQ